MTGKINSFRRFCVLEKHIPECGTTAKMLIKIPSSEEMYLVLRTGCFGAFITNDLGEDGARYMATVEMGGIIRPLGNSAVHLSAVGQVHNFGNFVLVEKRTISKSILGSHV